MLIDSLERGYGIRILLIELISLYLRTKGGKEDGFLWNVRFLSVSPQKQSKVSKKVC